MKIGKLVLVFGILFISPGLTWSDPAINAHVSATELTIDDTITLSVEVSGVSNIQAPQQLTIPDFQVQSAGRTQSFQWINGQTSSMITFNYVLSPLKTGTLLIPSIQLPTDKQPITTQPITVVVKPSGQKGGSAATPQINSQGAETPSNVPTEGIRPVFMSAHVDKTKAYIGEQILLTIQFLRRPNVGLASQPRYNEPDMTGFVVEPIKQQEFTTQLNGNPYAVTELRYALFPTTDGEFAIGNAAIDVRLQAPWDPFDPNNFFQNFFNQGQVVKLHTRAIPVQVRSLPKNKPDNFSGAVGRFKLTAHVDNSEPEVGKPLNLIVKIEGVGNIKALREPHWPDMKSFRRYESLVDTKVNNEGKVIYGSKEFKVLLIPQVSGSVTIPSLTFNYFNPDEHDFLTETALPISLQVKPGTLSAGANDSQSSDQTSHPAEGIQVIEKDIRFIKKGVIRPLQAPVLWNLNFWILNFIPPIFALGAAIATYRARHRAKNADYYRYKEAFHQARRSLHQSQKIMFSNPNGFFGALFSSLTEFLADKLGLTSSGLIWSDVENRLKEKNVDESFRQAVREIWDQTDMARFGTTAFSDEEKKNCFHKTKSLLIQLNKLL